MELFIIIILLLIIIGLSCVIFILRKKTREIKKINIEVDNENKALERVNIELKTQ